MVNFLNVFIGKIVLLIALIRIKTSFIFRTKYLIIKYKIITSINAPSFLSSELIKYIIAIEDKRYFSHIGLDFYSILRATYNRIFSNRIEGASTITQQLVRSITKEREIKINRKINEIMLGVLIDNEFSKSDILIAYSNLYQFYTTQGIIYFCKYEKYDLKNLLNHECQEIAARFKYPNINHSNYIRYLKRVRTIEKIASK